MPLHTRGISFARFHARGGKFNQRFDEVCLRSATPKCMPYCFPSLVGFPIVTEIKQIHRPMMRSFHAFNVIAVDRRVTGFTKAVPVRIADGMRKHPRYVRIRRKLPRSKSRWHGWKSNRGATGTRIAS